MESPRPYEGGGNYAVISSDFEDIDTTPTLEPRTRHEPPRRIADDDALPGEIDTTPQPIERQKEPTNRASEEPASNPHQPTEEEDNDPNRPKRSGWWQRKSFF